MVVVVVVSSGSGGSNSSGGSNKSDSSSGGTGGSTCSSSSSSSGYLRLQKNMTKTMKLITKHTNKHQECIPICTQMFWTTENN